MPNAMRHTTHTTRRPDTGFTLIEMLMVVAITAIVVGLSFPMIAAMKRDTSASAGVNTISLAVTAARRFATDPTHRFVRADLDTSPTSTSTSEPGVYSGVAALFTNAGEIRIVINDENAQWAANWYLERHGPLLGNLQPPGVPALELNGFKDLDGVEYVRLDADTAVAGITRNSTTAAASEPLVVPPPFAVWFDQNGYMVVTGQDPLNNRDNLYQYVYYDGNYNGSYECEEDRYNNPPYNPNLFNPNHGDFDTRFYDAAAGKYELPIEKIEAVIGVFVYSRAKFEEAVDNGDVEPWTQTATRDNKGRWDWLKENGQMLLFSRQTGMVMRNRNE